MGSELALGNCEEPVAGLGGLGRGAAVPRTSWELGESINSAAFCSPEIMCLAVVLMSWQGDAGQR